MTRRGRNLKQSHAFSSVNTELAMATQSTKDARRAQRIERKVADEGNVPATTSSFVGAAVLLAAILIAFGLLYLATTVPASVLGTPSQHSGEVAN